MRCVSDIFRVVIRSYPLTKRALLTYGDNNAAPPIELPDTKLFQSERGSLARNYFENKLELLNQEYKELVELAKLNEALYNANYNFVPRVGVARSVAPPTPPERARHWP